MKKRKLMQNFTNRYVAYYAGAKINAYTNAHANAYANVYAKINAYALNYAHAKYDSVLGKSISKELFHCAWMYLKRIS